MNFGSLFSGIGGLDLGLERAGLTCKWQSEINPYASRVLKKHWPATPNLGDINDIDWRTVPTVDLVCGGYPCQPFSVAGARNGANDPRHLWPRFADCIRILRPRFALLENVTGHLSLGFGDVQADLAALGYNTEWDCIPAAAVGAPHLRDRVFIIATRSDGMDTDSNSKSNVAINGSTQSRTENRPERRRSMADTNNGRSHDAICTGWNAPWNGGTPMADTGCQPTQVPASRRQSSQPQLEWRTWWQTEPRVGRVANGIPHRMDRLKGLGNAVVPQVAEHIGHIIMDMAK